VSGPAFRHRVPEQPEASKRRRLLAASGVALLAVLLGGVLVACAGSAPPAGTSPPTGLPITGTVTARPGCPGPERLDSPCPPRPVAGARVDVLRGGTIVTTVTTDAAGRFRALVPAGEYDVTAHNVGHESQATEHVTVDGPVQVSLVVDSGLR
jgi:Carboxypeptidase regulatory-like domain